MGIRRQNKARVGADFVGYRLGPRNGDRCASNNGHHHGAAGNRQQIVRNARPAVVDVDGDHRNAEYDYGLERGEANPTALLQPLIGDGIALVNLPLAAAKSTQR